MKISTLLAFIALCVSIISLFAIRHEHVSRKLECKNIRDEATFISENYVTRGGTEYIYNKILVNPVVTDGGRLGTTTEAPPPYTPPTSQNSQVENHKFFEYLHSRRYAQELLLRGGVLLLCILISIIILSRITE